MKPMEWVYLGIVAIALTAMFIYDTFKAAAWISVIALAFFTVVIAMGWKDDK